MRMLGQVGFVEDIRPRLVAFDPRRPELREWKFAKRDAQNLAELIRAKSTETFADLVDSWIRDGCPKRRGTHYSEYFNELDAWTEYWDIDQPQTQGLYYFGDDAGF